MVSRSFPLRHVHLDFHNHGAIPGVGRNFSTKKFQEALRLGHVESITLFAKCHHGWSYFDSKVGARHPHLGFDLLARQIDACRAINVACPIYLSAGVDERMAMLHPEWVIKQKNGLTYAPFEIQWFKLLRFNSAYLDHLCDHIQEVVKRWPDNDGIFLDIVGPFRDYSEGTLQEMLRLGLNPENESDGCIYAESVLLDYYQRTTAAARSERASTAVVHNGGHLAIGAEKFNRFNSHYEIESLPTGGWGYDHFNVSVRYAATQRKAYLGMTGKFHTTWGEFGGFKRPAALRAECTWMLANGAACSIGDQLHPSGKMNPDTYRLIGSAYSEVAAKEPWVRNAKVLADIAVLSADNDQERSRGRDKASKADIGAVRMLQEVHLPFHVLDRRASWSGYRLLILPDGLKQSAELQARLKEYIRRGGKVLAAGSALIAGEGQAFALNLGASLRGRSKYDPDYMLATALCPEISVRSPLVIHGGAYEIMNRTARVFAERRVPYFNRTWKHFCSHQHAPESAEKAGPAAILAPGSKVAYFAHDIFTRYAEYGQPLYRDFVVAAVDRLLHSRRLVRTTMPTTGRVSLVAQSIRRKILHLWHAVPLLRGKVVLPGCGPEPMPVEIIEDEIALQMVGVSILESNRVRSVRQVPDGRTLPFSQKGGILEFTVPTLSCHQMVEINLISA